MSTVAEKIKQFDTLCLDKDEQQQMEKLEVAERQAVRARGRHLAGFAWNSTKAVGFGSPIGAVDCVRKACQYNGADKQVAKIKEQQSDLRRRAKERYERTMGISVDKTLGWQKGDLCYGY